MLFSCGAERIETILLTSKNVWILRGAFKKGSGLFQKRRLVKILLFELQNLSLTELPLFDTVLYYNTFLKVLIGE
jgi:hypothetical protein